MASTAPGLPKAFEDRLPTPLARRFGTPAAVAWTVAFLLIAAFAVINYGVGLVLDAVVHPAAEQLSATVEPAGEPASVIVALPPPLQPKAAPASVPVTATPFVALQRTARSDSRRYRHGWGSRRWREGLQQPAGALAAPSLNPHAACAPGSANCLARASRTARPTKLLIGGLPKPIAGSGEAQPRKDAAIAAPRYGPPISLLSSSPE